MSVLVNCSKCGRLLKAQPHRSGGLRVRNHHPWLGPDDAWCDGSSHYDHRPWSER